MCTWSCSKFIQETMQQISSDSLKFYRRHYKKNILVSFFPDTVYFACEWSDNLSVSLLNFEWRIGLIHAVCTKTVPSQRCVQDDGGMSVLRGISNASCCRLFGLPDCCTASPVSWNKRYYQTSYVPLSAYYGIGSCSCCNPAHGPVDYRCCSINCL